MVDEGKSYEDAPRAAPRVKRSSGPASKPPAAKKAKTKKAPAKKAPAKKAAPADTNKDGKLSRSEAKAARISVSATDLNDDGRTTRSEARAVRANKAGGSGSGSPKRESLGGRRASNKNPGGRHSRESKERLASFGGGA